MEGWCRVSDVEIQELYAASYRRLLGQLIGVTGSVAEAEDVVQEAFVRGLDHPRRLLGADNPEAWLRTVAVNLARSRWVGRMQYRQLKYPPVCGFVGYGNIRRE
jgi:RNA polymerase sigma-70 factor, ECF subfamily